MNQKKNASLDVLYQTDNNYAIVTGVSIVSLLENNKDIDKIVIHLIDGGILKSNLDKIKQVVSKYHNASLNIINGKIIERKLKAAGCRPYKGSYVTYYKLFAYSIIKTKNNKILMLDGDILVLKSLKDICSINLNGYIMAEVIDAYMPKNLIRQLNIPQGQPYYNAGVMLINQKEWIDQKCESRIQDHWKNVKNDYMFADQDVVNVLFGKDIKELDLKYNYYSKNYMIAPYESALFNLNKEMLDKIRINGPVCVHCIDESWKTRPWFKGSAHTMIKEWDYYLGKSPWSNWSKLESNLNTYHRIDRIVYHILPRCIYAKVLKVVSYIFASMDISKKLLDEKKLNVKE